MSEQAHSPKKLRWWFWLVLFAPTILSPFIPAVVGAWVPPAEHYPHNWILGVSLYVFLALDFCAAVPAGMIQQRARTGSLSAAPVVVGTFSFFLLNAVTSYGGCAVIGLATTAFSK